jgi:PhnB protein
MLAIHHTGFIEENTMKLITYLFFDGQCEAAFKFYEQCLGGTMDRIVRASEAPGCDAMPAEWRDRIMHAHLIFGDQQLMGSDWIADQPFGQAKGFSVSLNVDTVAEAERVFAALTEGGEIRMPMEKTFFAVRFGMLVDRFGTPWMVNCEKDG